MSYGSYFVVLQGDAQNKFSVLHRKAAYTLIPFYDGANALHTNAVPGASGDGDTVLKANILPTVVDDLQKDLSVFLVKLYINSVPCLVLPKLSVSVDGIFQRVGQQYAQIALRNREQLGKAGMNGKGYLLCLRAGGIGGEQKVCRLISQ